MTAKFGMLISAKTTGANDIKRLGNSMQGVQGKAKNLGMAVKGVGLAFKAMFAAAAIGGITAFVKSSIDAADALGKLEVRTGIAAAKLQSYVNAGKLADVSQKQLATGLKTLARTQLEAADGVATYADAYNKLGVNVKNSDGTIKQSDQLLGEIADTFATLPDGPEKTAIALDIFGKSGADMITMLNGGKASLEEFNYQLSDRFAQNAEYYNDQVTKLGFKFEGFRMQLADALLPALSAITEVFADLFASGQDFTPLFKIIETGVRGVASVILGLVQSMRFFTRTIKDLVKIATLVASGKFGQAFDVAKTGLSETRDQFFKDIEAQGKVLFGTSEAPDSYGRRTGEVLPPGGGQDSTEEQAIKKRNAALSKGVDITLKQTASFAKMLQGLEDERRLLEAKILGKEKEVALEMKIEEKTRNLPPVIAAGVEQRIRGNAALQDTIDETKNLNTETKKTNALFESIKSTVGTGLTNAIMGLIDGTKSLGESLSGVLRQMASLFLQAGTKSLIGSIFASANGNVFAQNGIVPYAKGGYIGRPTMALMGEAGPEAVLPLRRGSNGKLGVESSGGGTSNVVVNVDASGSSVEGNGDQAAQLGKAIGIAVQQELIKQKRPGGLLTS